MAIFLTLLLNVRRGILARHSLVLVEVHLQLRQLGGELPLSLPQSVEVRHDLLLRGLGTHRLLLVPGRGHDGGWEGGWSRWTWCRGTRARARHTCAPLFLRRLKRNLLTFWRQLIWQSYLENSQSAKIQRKTSKNLILLIFLQKLQELALKVELAKSVTVFQVIP